MKMVASGSASECQISLMGGQANSTPNWRRLTSAHVWQLFKIYSFLPVHWYSSACIAIGPCSLSICIVYSYKHTLPFRFSSLSTVFIFLGCSVLRDVHVDYTLPFPSGTLRTRQSQGHVVALLNDLMYSNMAHAGMFSSGLGC